MGLIRILLAFAVLNGHVHLIKFLDGGLAVEIFYLISGFLISYILRNSTVYHDVRRFYLNRALRIFPIYYFVCAVALISRSLTQIGIPDFGHLGFGSKILLIASNVIIFGQDAVMFLRQHGNSLALAVDFRKTNPQLWTFLIVPPAWSLGLELTFYLIAPFVLKRIYVAGTLFILSLTMAATAWTFGLKNDPWSYRFFFFKLWVFLLGALTEQFWLPVYKSLFKQKWHQWIPVLASITVLCFATSTHPDQFFEKTALLICIAILLPGLFIFQQRGGRKFDVWLGDLSYPLYLCHYLVVVTLIHVWPDIRLFSYETRKLVASIIALLFAIFLERAIAQPIERYREKLRGKSAPIDESFKGSECSA